jgi:hypothetical protein
MRADHAADVLEHFGQIAAGLALDQHRRDEEGEVGGIDAGGGVLEAVFQRLAEAVLVVAAAELARLSGSGSSSAIICRPVLKLCPARMRSCIWMLSPSMPVISLTLVTFRLPPVSARLHDDLNGAGDLRRSARIGMS